MQSSTLNLHYLQNHHRLCNSRKSRKGSSAQLQMSYQTGECSVNILHVITNGLGITRRRLIHMELVAENRCNAATSPPMPISSINLWKPVAHSEDDRGWLSPSGTESANDLPLLEGPLSLRLAMNQSFFTLQRYNQRRSIGQNERLMKFRKVLPVL